LLLWKKKTQRVDLWWSLQEALSLWVKWGWIVFPRNELDRVVYDSLKTLLQSREVDGSCLNGPTETVENRD